MPGLCILFTLFATEFVYDYANAVNTQAFSWYSLLVSLDGLQYYRLLKMFSLHSCTRCVRKVIGQGRHFVTFQSTCLIF